MFTIIEPLWKLAMLFVAAILEIVAFIAGVLGVIGLAFGAAGNALRKIVKNAQGKIAKKLDNGKYEKKMKITTTAK